MAFSTPIESVVITPLANGAADLLDRVPQESESGWDTMRDTYLVRDDAAGYDPVAAVAARLQRGSVLPGMNMWIVSRSPRVKAKGLFLVEVVSMGLLSPRGYKVTYDAGSASQSGKDITINSTLYPKVQVVESAVTATLEYIFLGNSNSKTALVGTAAPPPGGWQPTVRASIWAAITDPTYHYPNGWIYDKTNLTNLPGQSFVWLVRDLYRYQYPFSP